MNRSRRGGEAFILLVLLVFAPSTWAQSPAPAEPVKHTFRIGLSRRSIGDLKRNDAQAAFQFWARAVLAQRAIANQAEAVILETPEAVRAAVTDPSIDGMATLTTELLEMGVQPESVFLTVRNGRYAQRYLLLVPQDSAVQTFAELAGQGILVPASPKMEMVTHWLGTALPDGGHGASPAVACVPVPTASKAVLRVFFRQAAASVVTATALEMAMELNPQISRKVRVLMESPELVSGIFFLTSSLPPRLRESLENTITSLHETPAGQQVLTVFQSDRLEKHDLRSLDATRALVDRARERGIAGTAWMAERSEP